MRVPGPPRAPGHGRTRSSGTLNGEDSRDFQAAAVALGTSPSRPLRRVWGSGPSVAHGALRKALGGCTGPCQRGTEGTSSSLQGASSGAWARVPQGVEPERREGLSFSLGWMDTGLMGCCVRKRKGWKEDGAWTSGVSLALPSSSLGAWLPSPFPQELFYEGVRPLGKGRGRGAA